MRMAALLGANALMLVAGLGMLPLLGIARSWRLLVFRCGLAYLCGLVLVGIVSAHLALVQVSVGWIGLVVMAALSLAFCAWRLNGTERPGWRRPSWVSAVGFAALVALIVDYGRAFRVAPLNRYDAWAIWALKGHALYAFGWADPVVFAGASYRFANLDYPLLLPSLEAIGFRAMGAFDTRLVHVQFLLFLVAALLALYALLRDRVPAVILWLSLFVLALAPAVFDQLLTAYADLPLALVFGVGVAAAGRWVVTNERWALALATFCFAGALLTKNEGSLFVLAVFLGLPGRRPRPLARAGRRGSSGRPAPASLAHLRPYPRPSRPQLQPRRQLRLRASARQVRRRADRVQDARRPDARSHAMGTADADLRRPARSCTADRPAGATALRTRLDDRRLAGTQLDLRDLPLRVQLIPRLHEGAGGRVHRRRQRGARTPAGG